MESNNSKTSSRLANIWSQVYHPRTLVALLLLLAVATIAYTQYGKYTTIPSSADSAPCVGSNCINLDSATTYQTMTGWEATSWAGSEFPGEWGSYVDEMLTKSVEDLGINRIRLEILSGAENPVDGWEQWRTCTNTADFCKNQWRSMRYNSVNDNTNPSSVNANGFHYSHLDEHIEHLVIPLRQKLQARGEQLYINVNYVDFSGSTGLHANNPEEYAEFVLNTYQHMQATYGFVPDSWEVSLEPDNTGANWTPAHLAAAMKAAGDRLVAAGFTPRFVAPSVTNINNTVSYIDAIAALSGAMQYVDTFSYHLYGGQSDSALQAIAAKAATHNKKTAQLEYIGATYQHLHKDLKIGQNSAWQQYTFGGSTPDDGGGYFYVTGNTVNMGSLATQLRQYFKYIRYGAVRIQATNTGNPFIDPLAFINTDGKYVVVTPVSGTTSFGVNNLPAGAYGIFYTTSGGVTTTLSTQTIPAGGSVSLTNIPAGVVTIYGTSASTPTPDTTPPVLSSGSPSGSQPAGTTSTNLTLSTNETATCKYGTTANTAYASLPSTFTTTNSTSHSTTVSSLSNGTSYNYYIRCQDTSSNPTTQDFTISFSVANSTGDTTSPTVSITAPSNSATVSGSSTAVSASAADNVGVVGVQFKLDGSNLGSEDTSAPYSITWNTTTASNASHTITAVARDSAGNSTTSASIAVTVDNSTPPTTVSTPSISPNGGSFSSTQSVTLSTATSGATIRYTIDGSTPTSSAGTVYTTPVSISSTTTLKAIAYKSGSTDSSVSSATFTITPTPPSTGGGGGGGGSSGGGGGGGGSSGGNNNPPSSPPVPPNQTPSNQSVILPSNVIAGQVIKFPDSPTIYLVQSTGLHPFDTWSSFQSYQSTSGAQIIARTGTASTYTISAVLAKTILEKSASTPTTPPTTTNPPAKGANFVCTGNPTIYYYNNNGSKEAYSELAVWQAWNGSGFSSVTNHPASACSTIPGSNIVRLPEGSFVKVSGGSEIYRIDGASARPYASYSAYQRDSAGKTTHTISIPYLHTYSRGQEIK